MIYFPFPFNLLLCTIVYNFASLLHASSKIYMQKLDGSIDSSIRKRKLGFNFIWNNNEENKFLESKLRLVSTFSKNETDIMEMFCQLNNLNELKLGEFYLVSSNITWVYTVYSVFAHLFRINEISTRNIRQSLPLRKHLFAMVKKRIQKMPPP